MFICQEVNYRPATSKIRKDYILIYSVDASTKKNAYGRSELMFVIVKTDVVIPNLLKVGWDIMELPRMDISIDFYKEIKGRAEELTWGTLLTMDAKEEVLS